KILAAFPSALSESVLLEKELSEKDIRELFSKLVNFQTKFRQQTKDREDKSFEEYFSKWAKSYAENQDIQSRHSLEKEIRNVIKDRYADSEKIDYYMLKVGQYINKIQKLKPDEKTR